MEVQTTLPGLDVDPGPEPGPEPVFTSFVRVSDSVKVGDHIVSISMENCPLEQAAAAIIDLVATLRAGVALAALEPEPPAIAPAIAPAQAAPEAPQASPAPPVVPAANTVDPVVVMRFIPASDVLHMKRADTENGAMRVRFKTKQFQQPGLICWVEQDREAVKRPFDLAGIDVAAMKPGEEYGLPANVKGISVRFKASATAGRPTPDRVVELVLA